MPPSGHTERMRRPVTLVLAWVVATGVAVAAASMAVSVVAAQVSTELPPPAFEDDPGPPASASPQDVSTTPPSRTPGPASSVDDDPREGAQTPDPVTRTVHAVGGSTGLRFTDGRVTILWATPDDGFGVRTEGSGTSEVRVEFRSDDHRSRIDAHAEDEGPAIQVDEEADSEDVEPHEEDDD